MFANIIYKKKKLELDEIIRKCSITMIILKLSRKEILNLTCKFRLKNNVFKVEKKKKKIEWAKCK